MNFNATATIQSIEKPNERFFKVLLQDERRQHIVVNVPIDKAEELEVGGKVIMWGNVSAFNYQSKWYNNLFAQTVVPVNKQFILVKKVVEDEHVHFQIIQYAAEPFSLEYINENFPNENDQSQVIVTAPDSDKSSPNSEIISTEIENGVEQIKDNPSSITFSLLSDEEYEKLDAKQKLFYKIERSKHEATNVELPISGKQDFLTFEKLKTNLENLKKGIEKCNSNYYNLEYWHLQNSIIHQRIELKENLIILNTQTEFSVKECRKPDHNKLLFSEGLKLIPVIHTF